MGVLLAYRRSFLSHRHDASRQYASVAFVGNSMFYFNDFPRFFQTLSEPTITIEQDCCLHGFASIPSLVKDGSGMYPQFKTEHSILPQPFHNKTLYDYGSCTVKQLLLGEDDALLDATNYSQQHETDDSNSTHNQNPCVQDDNYRLFLIEKHHNDTSRPSWDYVVINDNTRNPARNATRLASLATLQNIYIPWLQETGATPVFLWTHAYIPFNVSNDRDMTGLEDIANFTSLTGVGLRAYRDLLEQHLSTTPRIAPVGLAFLTIYEEEPEIWKSLFHNADHLHASPSGTFLQACVVYHTLFGSLPDVTVLQTDEQVADLWSTARMMQHDWEPPNPLPTLEQVQYLYSIAERIANGYIPKTYIDYENGETAYEGDG